MIQRTGLALGRGGLNFGTAENNCKTKPARARLWHSTVHRGASLGTTPPRGCGGDDERGGFRGRVGFLHETSVMSGATAARAATAC